MKQLFAITLLAAAGAANAIQVVDAVDGATVHVKISAKDQTRLLIERGRISSLRIPRGQLHLSPDDETGQVFLTVADGVTKPVSGFLTTEAGLTFTVVLTPSDLPAETVVFRPPTSTQRTQLAAVGKTGTPFEKDLKRLNSVMANDEPADGVEVRNVNQEVILWQEARMTLDKQFVMANVIGERFVVTNVSKSPMVLGEQEFYRRGVHTVAIEQLNLAPGVATRVFVVRDKAIND
jgi:conjugal transfer pilus assembly protein TraK